MGGYVNLEQWRQHAVLEALGARAGADYAPPRPFIPQVEFPQVFRQRGRTGGPQR